MTQTLEQLSAAATQGEWIVHEYSLPSERRMIWDAPSAKNMCIECVKPDDAAFICQLVNLYRTGQLVAVQADDATVERVARALDPEIWSDNQPIPTRGDTIDFHARRQKSISQAKAAISALAAKGDA